MADTARNTAVDSDDGGGRTYDLMLSYRRTNLAFAEQFVERLSKDYGLAVFLDKKEHPPGEPWSPQWKEALSRPPYSGEPKLGPGVIVLATSAIAEHKPDIDHVVRELREAVEASCNPNRYLVPILVLRFNSTGYAELVRRTKADFGWDPDERHQPDSFENIPVDNPDQISPEQWRRICDAAVRVARASVFRRLEECRREARQWAKELLARTLSTLDLSDATADMTRVKRQVHIAIEKRERQQVAVVGPSGHGKSMQVARLIEEFCGEGQRLYPVLLSGADLDRPDCLEFVRTKLGLGHAPNRDPLADLEDVHLRCQGRVVFVTDSLELTDDVAQAASCLQHLRDAGGLWVTSRPAAWEAAQRELQFDAGEVIRVREIGDGFVARHLGAAEDFVRARPYLRQAIYLDLARHLLEHGKLHAAQDNVAWHTPTALLATFVDWSTQSPSGSVEHADVATHAAHFLVRLAREQVRRGGFLVDIDELLDPAEREDPSWNAALHFLRETRRLLIEERVTVGPEKWFVRLRHNLIDAFNIAREASRDATFRDAVVDSIGLAFGQALGEGLAQLADDYGRADILREQFVAFLLACDNKQDTAVWNPRAWGGTYLVQNQIAKFLPLIVAAIGGEYLGHVLPARVGEPVSSIDPPRLTRDALSSVASTLLGAAPLSISDRDGRMLAAFRQRVAGVERKGRLIEALARFDDGANGALDALIELAGDETAIANDPELARYLAATIRDVANARQEPRPAQQALEALDALLRYAKGLIDQPRGIDMPTFRVLGNARDEIALVLRKPPTPMPIITPHECEQGLALHAYGRPCDLADWRVFRHHTESIKVNRGKFGGVVSEPVVLALGRGLWHDHIASQIEAARALGAIDHPFARGLLLATLATASNDRLEEAVLAGLKSQAIAHPKPDSSFRIAIRRAAAQRWMNLGTSRETDLLERVLDGVLPAAGRIVTSDMIELARLTPSCQFVWDASPSDQTLAEQFAAEHAGGDPGPEIESKVRLLPPNPGVASSLTSIKIAPSEWGLSCRFHRAVNSGMEAVPRYARETFRKAPPSAVVEHDRKIARHVATIARVHSWLEQSLVGDSVVPGLGVVHALVVTADGFVLEGLRSAQSLSHPNCWAASFEEQIRAEECELPASLAAVIARGMREEFGVALNLEELRIDAAMFALEWPTLNGAIVATVSVDRPLAELLSRPNDEEVAARRGTPLADRLDSLERSRLGGLRLSERDGRWHPTAASRVELLRTYRK